MKPIPQSPSTENVPTQRSKESPDQHHHRLPDRLTTQSVLRPLRIISFWIAVILPFLYLPLLGTGFESQPEIVAFLLLVAVNIVALLVGHRHNN